MDTSLKVRRKRRGRSLYKKIFEYEELFNVRIAIIAQEKSNGDYEIFQPVPTENWPPAMKDIVRDLKSRSLELTDHDRTPRSYIPAGPPSFSITPS